MPGSRVTLRLQRNKRRRYALKRLLTTGDYSLSRDGGGEMSGCKPAPRLSSDARLRIISPASALLQKPQIKAPGLCPGLCLPAVFRLLRQPNRPHRADAGGEQRQCIARPLRHLLVREVLHRAAAFTAEKRIFEVPVVDDLASPIWWTDPHTLVFG
jgi:hypothetical protein